MTEIDAERSALVVAGEASVKEYAELRAGIAECEREMLTHMTDPARALTFLVPGRMIRVKDGDTDWGWGAVVNVVNVGGGGGGGGNGGGTNDASSYIVDTLLQCAPGAAEGRLAPAPRVANGKKGQLAEKGCTVEVIPVALKLVAAFGALRLTLPDDLRQRHARESVGLAFNELHQRFANEAFPRLDPVADMKISDPGAVVPPFINLTPPQSKPPPLLDTCFKGASHN